MMVQYRPNISDQTIINEITNRIRASLSDWYGRGSRLNSAQPGIRSYPNCFMLCYPISISAHEQKNILVKIRRLPKMRSLNEALQADIHRNMILEYQNLELVYSRIGSAGEGLGAIRPLALLQKYFAILMEEFPSQTLRQLMEGQRSAMTGWDASALKDAARKTGRWLYFFHHQVNTAFEKKYSSRDILEELRPYAEKIESSSRGRVRSAPILAAFSGKLQNLAIDHVRFSQCHLDMTTNNVLYSEQGKVCMIDIKNRPAPVYMDLGMILSFPETSKPQIFSAGTYYSDSLLQNYRTEILAGYFEHEQGDELLIRIDSAINVVIKWSMYEELMGKYKGLKKLLSIPAAPLVSSYFQNLLRKYLKMIGESQSGQTLQLADTVNRTT